MEVYSAHASEYEELVSREDYEGNVLKSLQEIESLAGLDVLDLGAGTGRLAGLLAPRVRSMLAFDLSPHMLQIARDKLRLSGLGMWMAAAADHRHLPLRSRTADLIVSGWSVSYVAIWHPENWRAEAEAWLQEARRLLRPNGQVVLFESLGTGTEVPQRLPQLESFYYWLDEKGFTNKWIRTDYRFETPQIADELTAFFFGDEMKLRIKHGVATTLPECTGVWWQRFA
jgi:ubiquinone/menaquinone biosynthesis C-methylase UbiE